MLCDEEVRGKVREMAVRRKGSLPGMGLTGLAGVSGGKGVKKRSSGGLRRGAVVEKRV